MTTRRPTPLPDAHDPLQLTRRSVMKGAASLLGGCIASPVAHAAAGTLAGAQAPPVASGAPGVDWIVTTRTAPWQRAQPQVASGPGMGDIIVQPRAALQAVEGFGACFNELGWTSLGLLAAADREAVMRELFASGVGANFTTCRMPIGANDFSRDWYSYDETPGDFDLQQFSIANDLETLVPFIRAARQHQPDLRLWASPWSPPTWMKVNKHYAMAMPAPSRPGMQGAENGLRPDQVGREGVDMFVQDEKYLRAYAAYFGRFIDEYKKLGIPIWMVMPQNEFNSAQVFPSCCWTANGLARFIGHLGPEMEKRGVTVFFGTMERPNEGLVEVALNDSVAGRYIKGIGFQWAGKAAVPYLHRRYPQLAIYQSEQECGDGKNDWRYCRYTWNLMKHYFRNGASAYHYWNISLKKGGISRWGWAQNSLVVVDADAKTYAYTHEYYLMKHLSHFVRPGAHLVEIAGWTGYDNQLAFANPDGSLVVVVQNDMSEPMPMRIAMGGKVVSATLPADSFSTFVARA